MELTITDQTGESILVRYNQVEDYRMFEGKVYPFPFISDYDGHLMEEVTEETKEYFSFSFCWRGCWEGRVYFNLEEYWSEEISIMSRTWDTIEKELKKLLKEKYSDIWKD